jgi:hypothetical protein
MITKEKVKIEIDKMPNELSGKAHKNLHGLNSQKITKRKLHTISLKGQFDDINIREKAIEHN